MLGGRGFELLLGIISDSGICRKEQSAPDLSGDEGLPAGADGIHSQPAFPNMNEAGERNSHPVRGCAPEPQRRSWLRFFEIKGWWDSGSCRKWGAVFGVC